MPKLPPLDGDYEEGSPWPPSGPNQVANASLAYQREWSAKHDQDRHDDPLIPSEAATVDSAGNVISGSAGIAVSRTSLGVYLIDLSGSPMAIAEEWFAHAYPDPVSSDVCFPFESVQAAAKTTTQVEVRFVDDAGNYRDTGFWVGCFGVRA